MMLIMMKSHGRIAYIYIYQIPESDNMYDMNDTGHIIHCLDLDTTYKSPNSFMWSIDF